MKYEAPDALVALTNNTFESTSDVWGDRWEVEIDPAGEE